MVTLLSFHRVSIIRSVTQFLYVRRVINWELAQLSQVYAMIDQGDLETTKNKPKRIKSLSVKAHLNDQGIL